MTVPQNAVESEPRKFSRATFLRVGSVLSYVIAVLFEICVFYVRMSTSNDNRGVEVKMINSTARGGNGCVARDTSDDSDVTLLFPIRISMLMLLGLCLTLSHKFGRILERRYEKLSDAQKRRLEQFLELVESEADGDNLNNRDGPSGLNNLNNEPINTGNNVEIDMRSVAPIDDALTARRIQGTDLIAYVPRLQINTSV
jgi:hypothetical protein